jgi:hypothetical protein
LFNSWNQRLEDSGFEDIEDQDCQTQFYIGTELASDPVPAPPLKVWHARRPDIFTVDPETESYYRMAERLLQVYEFKNPTHRRIWELHTKGLSKRKIEKAIARMKKSYKREQIGNIIAEIEKEIV